MRYRIVLAIIILPIFCLSQDKDTLDLWASPSVKGMQLGKGVILSYKRMSPYNVVSISQVPELVESASADIERISNLQFKIRFPVLLKEQTQVVVGLEYNVDEFEFEDIENISYQFYEELHHMNLRGRGLKIYMNRSLSKRKFIIFRGTFEINGDIPEEEKSDAFRYGLSGLYGWKLSPSKSWGFGFFFNYSFGRPLLLPTILYNNTWNSNWGIEMILPGSLLFRYTINEKNLLYAGYNVQGGSYNIDLGSTLNERFDDIQIRRSEVMPHISYEREIYDFIWMSFEAGFRYNINFNVTEDNIFDEKRILINDVSSGIFVGASIFILPTESLKKLVKKK